ncbi:MAG TPA: hypothetical protein VK660_05220 [Xanthomonadaceae bacterium]|jgi:CTP-dependent riboflavin kinase|nr:hypothetical protein [Xanthomonadaceae bacterium]
MPAFLVPSLPGTLKAPATAARDRPDPWVVEVVSDVKLRAVHDLEDGDLVDVELPLDQGCAT